MTVLGGGGGGGGQCDLCQFLHTSSEWHLKSGLHSYIGHLILEPSGMA